METKPKAETKKPSGDKHAQSKPHAGDPKAAKPAGDPKAAGGKPPEPKPAPYTTPIKPYTKGNLEPLEVIFDEKLSRYEKLVWDNKSNMEKVQDLLNERKEDIADKLVLQAATYQGWMRNYIKAASDIEDGILIDYYENRKEMKNNFRHWRQRYVHLLSDPNSSANLRASIQMNPETFSKFLRPDVSGLTDSGWANIIVPKAALSKNETKLGEGAFGRVFRGIVHGTVLAIKELKQENLSQLPASKIESFEKEIKLFSTLHHDNILKFMGGCLPTGTDQENYYAFLTELAENGSLFDCLYQPRVPIKFSFSKKMTILSEIVAGMSYLHTLPEPVYHLDLKTANILLDVNYSVRIADFGLSKIFLPESVINSAIGNFIGGTPYYMAPEILLGKFDIKEADKADVYAFAVLVNEFIDEKVPYTGVITDKIKMEDFVKRVSKGEEPGKNRPLMAHAPSTLKEMIKNCWKEDCKSRPSFVELRNQKPWEQARVSSSAAGDKNTAQLVELFKHTKTVRFGSFVKKCAEVLSESNRLFLRDEIQGPFDGPYVRTLIVALGIPKGSENITEDSVRRLLNWVHKARKNEILDLLYSFFTKDYFFGIMEDNEIKDLLSRSPKAGTYCVRWSNQAGTFVLDYIPKKKKGDKGGAELQIESLHLNVSSIGDLESSLSKTLNELSLSKEAICGNRPALLVSLKIKETFVTSSSTSYSSDTGGGTDKKADLSQFGTVSHYEFIL